MQKENDYDFDGSPDRVSKGVRVNDIPHVIQITDCESRDADYSVVSQTGESGDTNKLTSDTDGGYYKLHIGKKTNKSPKKIEFEKVNRYAPKVKIRKRFLPRQCNCMQHRNYDKSNLAIVGHDKPLHNMFPFNSNMPSRPDTPTKIKRPKGCFLSFFRKKFNLPCLANTNNMYNSNLNTTLADDLENSVNLGNNPGTKNIENSNYNQKIAKNDEKYFFDHGNVDYFHTTDCPPHLVSEMIARQTSIHATKFWAEIFGTINIGVMFIVSFILQLYKFILYGVFRSLFAGILQISSDYLLKPFLTILFNGFLQPPLTFIHNIITSLANISEEVSRILENGFKPITTIIRAFRLVEVVKNENCQTTKPTQSQQVHRKEVIIDMSNDAGNV